MCVHKQTVASDFCEFFSENNSAKKPVKQAVRTMFQQSSEDTPHWIDERFDTVFERFQQDPKAQESAAEAIAEGIMKQQKPSRTASASNVGQGRKAMTDGGFKQNIQLVCMYGSMVSFTALFFWLINYQGTNTKSIETAWLLIGLALFRVATR